MKERFKKPLWKFPGGLADFGEHFDVTVCREIYEECGVRAAFERVLCFRHQLNAWFGDVSDVYVVCGLRALSSEIKIDGREIMEARWLPLAEYVADPDIADTNKYFARLALLAARRGDTAPAAAGGPPPVHMVESELLSIVTGAMTRVYTAASAPTPVAALSASVNDLR